MMTNDIQPLTTGSIDNHSRLVAIWLEGRSESTRRAYARDLEVFAAFAGLEDGQAAAAWLVSLAAGDANRTVVEWRGLMLNDGFAPATVDRRLAALRSVVDAAKLLGMVAWSLKVPSVKSKAYLDTRGPGIQEIQSHRVQNCLSPLELSSAGNEGARLVGGELVLPSGGRYSRELCKRLVDLLNSHGVSDERALLVRLYIDERLSLRAIAGKFNFSAPGIKKKMQRFGIQTRKSGYLRPDSTAHFFETIGPAQAWVLGLISTDGNITQYTWSIAQKDRALLDKVQVAMGSELPLTRDKRTGVHAITAADVKAVQRLAEFGLRPRKSRSVTWPGWLTEETASHFIRGCWDGDGSVYCDASWKWAASFVSGSKHFIHGLEQTLRENGLPRRTIYTDKRSKTYSIRFTGVARVARLAEFLYRDADPGICLGRKRKKFLSVSSSFCASSRTSSRI